MQKIREEKREIAEGISIYRRFKSLQSERHAHDEEMGYLHHMGSREHNLEVQDDREIVGHQIDKYCIDSKHPINEEWTNRFE